MSISPVSNTPAAGLATGAWQLDPSRSSVEFHVRHFYGLMTVKGHFERYEGSLDLARNPAVALVIDADSLDTQNARRDKHLRSQDFFDVAEHPQVRFEAASAQLTADAMKASGTLTAAGKHVPMDVEAAVTQIDGEYEIEATAHVDHRQLGMTWSPLGILRAPSELIVRGRLVSTVAI